MGGWVDDVIWCVIFLYIDIVDCFSVMLCDKVVLLTEKRFYIDVDDAIIDSRTRREYITWDIGMEDICNLLN